MNIQSQRFLSPFLLSKLQQILQPQQLLLPTKPHPQIAAQHQLKQEQKREQQRQLQQKQQQPHLQLHYLFKQGRSVSPTAIFTTNTPAHLPTVQQSRRIHIYKFARVTGSGLVGLT